MFENALNSIWGTEAHTLADISFFFKKKSLLSTVVVRILKETPVLLNIKLHCTAFPSFSWPLIMWNCRAYHHAWISNFWSLAWQRWVLHWTHSKKKCLYFSGRALTLKNQRRGAPTPLWDLYPTLLSYGEWWLFTVLHCVSNGEMRRETPFDAIWGALFLRGVVFFQCQYVLINSYW